MELPRLPAVWLHVWLDDFGGDSSRGNLYSMSKVKALIILFILGLGFTAHPAQAAFDCTKTDFGRLESPLNAIMKENGQGKSICEFINGSGGKPLIYYISIVIDFVTAMIVAMGLIAIVVAGYFYMTAGGSSDRISTAKSLLASALLGIVLALAAFLILNTISPQFASEVKEPCLKIDCAANFQSCIGKCSTLPPGDPKYQECKKACDDEFNSCKQSQQNCQP